MDESGVEQKGELERIELQKKIGLRREARKKKILENAKTRLDRLNDRGQDANKLLDSALGNNDNISDPEVEPDIPPAFLQQTPNQIDLNQLFTAINSENVSPKKKHVVFQWKLHILVSAILTYILSMVGNEGYKGVGVFPLAGILVILELTFFKEQNQLNPFTNLFITMCGFQTKRANIILQFLSTIQTLFIDVGIIVFFYCSLSLLLAFAKSGLLNLTIN